MVQFYRFNFWNYCSSRESSHSFMGNSPTLTRGNLFFLKREFRSWKVMLPSSGSLFYLDFREYLLVRIVVYVQRFLTSSGMTVPRMIEIEHNGPWKWHVWYFYVFRASIWYGNLSLISGVPYPTTKERGSLHRVGTGHCSLPGMWSPWSPGQISKKSRQIRCLNFKKHIKLSKGNFLFGVI